MLPIAIFRHLAIEGPGHLADFLDARARPWTLIAVDAGADIPDDPRAFSGLVFMGGPMSVNDELPWIPQSLALIRTAVATGIPVLGHCLGGQLMARALGGTVTRAPVKEIGWGSVRVASDRAEAHAWLGGRAGFQAFHWHGETFSLPEGAVPLLSSAYCANQAFALGPHLALQCHIEMTPGMIADWCRHGADEIAASDSPAVQTPAEILGAMDEHLPGLHRVADDIYSHWLAGTVS